MPDTVTNLAGYNIELVSVSCVNNEQTWRYRITFTNPANPPSPEISNWALQLCPNQVIDETAFVSPPNTEPTWDQFNPNNPGQNIQPCLFFQGVLAQVKWDFNDPPGGNAVIAAGGENGAEFQFTISNGCFVPGDVWVSIKAGGGQTEPGQPPSGCNYARITGPTCEPLPPSNRGVDFQKISI